MKYTEEQIRTGAEKAFIMELLEKNPKGILSYVSDSYDLWAVLTKILPTIKERILARDGKLVIRPDSGDPVDIICGNAFDEKGNYIGQIEKDMLQYYDNQAQCEHKGVIELLWDVFGGTINEQGYKVLDPHIGAIYGDSITLERAEEICARLEAKGFASTNVVFGIGSYTYQFNTRDTFGFAMKATYVEITKEEYVGTTPENIELQETVTGFEIFKDPVTDTGMKKSARGLLRVLKEGDTVILHDQCTWDDVDSTDNQLKLVFRNGKFLNYVTLGEIRERVNKLI